MSYTKEAPLSIKELFDSIAPRYDLGNSLLSFHLHALWNRTLVRAVTSMVGPTDPVLDLCCGTGDIAARLLHARPGLAITMADFSPRMLAIAQQRLPNCHCVQADAQALPFADGSFSAVTIAYGIRNINNPLQCIEEAFRVLQPGGLLAIVELTRPANRLMRWLHAAYTQTALPIVGRWLTGNRDAYAYLQRSIQAFMAPEELASMGSIAGFASAKVKPLCGGIATLILLQKP